MKAPIAYEAREAGIPPVTLVHAREAYETSSSSPLICTTLTSWPPASPSASSAPPCSWCPSAADAAAAAWT